MERSEAVRSAIERFCERFATADLAGFEASLADEAEAFVIGTQRWTSGREEWLGNFRAARPHTARFACSAHRPNLEWGRGRHSHAP